MSKVVLGRVVYYSLPWASLAREHVEESNFIELLVRKGEPKMIIITQVVVGSTRYCYVLDNVDHLQLWSVKMMVILIYFL